MAVPGLFMPNTLRVRVSGNGANRNPVRITTEIQFESSRMGPVHDVRRKLRDQHAHAAALRAAVTATHT